MNTGVDKTAVGTVAGRSSVRQPIFYCLLLVSLCSGTSASAQGVAPIGVEFQINAEPGGSSHVAASGAGSAVVVWGALITPTTSGLVGQLINSEGLSGSNFLVTQTSGAQYQQAAMAPDGNFIVVWQTRNLARDYNVMGRLFDNQGTPRGPEITISGHNAGWPTKPSAAVLPDGGYVVAWNEGAMKTLRLDADGLPVGSDTVVTQLSGYYPDNPRIAAGSFGSVVAWQSERTPAHAPLDPVLEGVFGRWISSTGEPLSDQLLINTFTDNGQFTPDVASSRQGQVIIVWSSEGSNGTDLDSSVQGQRFLTDGTTLGGEFQINTHILGFQIFPDVAMNRFGDFVVTWMSGVHGSTTHGPDGDGYGIQARYYKSDGSPIGEEFQVNTTTFSSQQLPTAAFLSEDEFVIVWDDYGPPIQAQIFGIDDDGDGVATTVDNCPSHYNPAQLDSDEDDTGDLCDLCAGFDDRHDADGDAVPDGCDTCLGNDLAGDNDSDGVCADEDCNDFDSSAQFLVCTGS